MVQVDRTHKENRMDQCVTWKDLINYCILYPTAISGILSGLLLLWYLRGERKKK